MDLKIIVKKEILEGLRNYRFLIVAIGMLFFAVFDPVMNKLILPELLKSQFPNMSADIVNQMLVNTQTANIRGYLTHVYQISTLIISFTLSGLLAQEISEKTLIFPMSTGKRIEGLLLGKMIVYGGFLLLLTSFSILVNYAYSGVLFGFELPSVYPVLRAGLYLGIFMIFVLALLILFGALVRKPIPAGMLTLLVAYGVRAVGSLLNGHRFLPSGLLVEAEMLAVVPSEFIWGILASSIAMIAVLIGLSIYRMLHLEITRG